MKKRILVVETDPAVCRGVQKLLAMTRNTVYFAGDAVAAITEARKREVDLMIVAFSLPAGSGITVAERARMIPELARVPIIMIAERSARLEAPRAFQAGVDAFLPKPVDPYVLLDYVGRFLPTEAPMLWLDTTQVHSGNLV